MYTWPFTVLVWYMYMNNNNNKRYHRNRETIDTSDPCIHARSLYWSGTCTLLIIIWYLLFFIIINVHVPDQYSERSCIHVSEVSIVSLFLWYLLLLLLIMYMYQTSTVNEHVYMADTCIHDRSLYWSGTCTLIIIKNKRYHRNRETIDNSDTCIHDRSLYWSGTCTLIIIIIIKDIIETENQLIHLTHVYMTAHCTGLVHVH
jgi:hypothetical protein